MIPAFVAFLATVFTLQAADGVPRVRFISPADGESVLGKTHVEILAESPAGHSILKVEIYVDDTLLTTLLDPPYTAAWDAGDSLGARRLRAKVYTSNGATASATLTTRALRGVQRALVTLVEVYCTVRDSAGRYITDLKREDFIVRESGLPQDIAVFSAERKPVHLVLLFDSSNSMKQDDKLGVAQEAAVGFVEALEPGDTAAIITFDDVPRVLEERTDDHQGLIDAIASIEAKGGTALYDAILAAVDQVKGHEGRKALVLLSDGRDESVDGLGPGSVSTFEEALEAVLESETAVYAIGTGSRLEDQYDYYHRRTVGEILSTLAERSGGRAHFIRKASKLKGAYRSIEDELRHQYTLAYYPPADPPDARKIRPGERDWRPIEVAVERPRVRVTARSGYYAR